MPTTPQSAPVPPARTLTFDQFEEEFKPVTNHLEGNAPVNGFGFETFGAQLAFARAAFERNPKCVWTVVEGDAPSDEDSAENDSDEDRDGAPPVWYILQGWHHVNRLCYLVTEVPFTENLEPIEY